jgi:hypothetical protein
VVAVVELTTHRQVREVAATVAVVMVQTEMVLSVDLAQPTQVVVAVVVVVVVVLILLEVQAVLASLSFLTLPQHNYSVVAQLPNQAVNLFTPLLRLAH